jgi:predicted DsbA family dithiol-disulfide isomerase
MSRESSVLEIDVYSDVICPWCYVGKRRLERALRQVGATVKASVVWRPFQLNPTMPTPGMNRRVYLETKFGSLAVFNEMEQRLLEAGREEQISFAFDKIVWTPNTFLAHRLIWYAGVQGCQDAVVDQLFRGYFEEGLNIGASSVLIELADRAGLKAAAQLESDTGIEEVKTEEAVGHGLGIRAVPYFVFNQSYGLSGAQPGEVLAAAMEKAQSTVGLTTTR